MKRREKVGGNRCPKCNLGGMTAAEFKAHRCSRLGRETRAERDERIVAEARLPNGRVAYWSAAWSSFPLHAQVYAAGIRDVNEWKRLHQAAARILNRISRARRGKK